MAGELRTLIEKMVSDLDAYPLEAHPGRLQKIAQIVPHSILPLQSSEPLTKYNCVLHALGLVGTMTEYQHPLMVAGTPFLAFLVAEALQPCEPRTNALVVWSSEGIIKHVGKLVAPNRAESKWGAGILCEHGLDEIPLRYGSVSGFYDPIDPESARDHLCRFLFGTQT
jgi:hypothetical protein